MTFSSKLQYEVMSTECPNCLGSMKTIPHLLTVAGEAYDKSSTSNIMVIVGFSLII
jgi:hypothetical protein